MKQETTDDSRTGSNVWGWRVLLWKRLESFDKWTETLNRKHTISSCSNLSFQTGQWKIQRDSVSPDTCHPLLMIEISPFRCSYGFWPWVPVTRLRAKQLQVNLAKTNCINARQPEWPVNNGPTAETCFSLLWPFTAIVTGNHAKTMPSVGPCPNDLLHICRRRGSQFVGPQFVGPSEQEDLTESKLRCRWRLHTHSNCE